ncbi:MAG TPA: MAPEG family protein [Lysobacter sp.]
MSIAVAYWCVFVAAVLPYVWTVLAKARGERYDNRDPRAWLACQTDPRVSRANAAQLNAFEAFPAFAAGVVMADIAGVHEARIALLAVVFVVARVLHGVFYVRGIPQARSLAWLVGFVCVAALLVQAALAIR